MTDITETKYQTGTLLNIERCSLHDGPGIRTTVFFKGCPLRCVWCHNPESQLPEPQPAFFPELCTGCGKCVSACPQKAHVIYEGCHSFLWERCVNCGLCAHICTGSAMKYYGYIASIGEIMVIVEKDLPYYSRSGGGLTVSGGEPFAQHDFLLALLMQAKRRGIHTCVETSGLVPPEKLLETLPYTSMFLLDWKHTNPEKHRQYTGTDNKLTRQNLDLLMKHKASVILRCPIIPGINDTAEHFSGIAWLERTYPELKAVEILPYHNFGAAKARAVGHKNAFYLQNVPPGNEKPLETADDGVRLLKSRHRIIYLNRKR